MTKYVSLLSRIPLRILTKSNTAPIIVRAVIAALFLAGRALLACPLPACLPGTVASYIDQRACGFFGFTYSDFSYAASGTSPLAPDQIGVVPLAPDWSRTGIDGVLSFQAPWTVSGLDSTPSTISWTITIFKKIGEEHV
jgi:hypothetical protein